MKIKCLAQGHYCRCQRNGTLNTCTEVAMGMFRYCPVIFHFNVPPCPVSLQLIRTLPCRGMHQIVLSKYYQPPPPPPHPSTGVNTSSMYANNDQCTIPRSLFLDYIRSVTAWQRNFRNTYRAIYYPWRMRHISPCGSHMWVWECHDPCIDPSRVL